MDLQHIEALVTKYLEGETSLKEEQQLRQYFSSDTVAPHLQEYVVLFTFFNTAKGEQYNKAIHLDTSKPKTNYKAWMAVAASTVLLAFAVWYGNSNSVSQSDLGTYEDPEVALQKTKDILNLVSSYMNEGKEDLGYLAELDIAKDKILKDN